MKYLIDNFISAKKDLNAEFNCKEDFFINPLIENKWTIKDNDGIFFLTYWDNKEKLKECVIVKKDNSPLIFKNEDYTMIIGIECIKLAFILKNSNML